MQIKIGWSAEVNSQWQKLDVDVSDQDLLEFFLEQDAEDTMVRLTPKRRFVLMTGIAEELILAHKASHYPTTFPVEEIRAELRDLLSRRAALLKTMKDELA